MTDALEMSDALSAAVQKTPNRVTLDQIRDKIDHIDYFHPERHPHMTIAMLTLNNGYVVIGKSAPADPENFDVTVGMQFAYEDAVRQIWPLMAFALREKMTEAG